MELLSKCLCSLNFSSYCPDYLCGCGSSHSPTAISSSSDFPTSLTFFSGNSIYTHIRQPKLPHVSLVNYSFVVVAVVVISFFFLCFILGGFYCYVSQVHCCCCCSVVSHLFFSDLAFFISKSLMWFFFLSLARFNFLNIKNTIRITALKPLPAHSDIYVSSKWLLTN